MSDRPSLPVPDASFPEVREARDDRLFRGAVFAALVVHLGLFCVVLPEASPVVRQAESPQAVKLAPTPRIERPEPPVEPRKPRAERPTVPVPDLTPDVEPFDEPTPLVEPVVTADVGPATIPSVAPPAPVEAVQPPPTGPVHLGPSIHPPVRLEAAGEIKVPQYTKVARHAKIEGVVTLQAVIGTDGRVSDVEVLAPLPLGLTEQAIRAVKTWRYEPATRNGRPIAVYLRVEVDFRVARNGIH